MDRAVTSDLALRAGPLALSLSRWWLWVPAFAGTTALCAAMPYHVYILASRRYGTLYIGITNNLQRRLEQHRLGRVGIRARIQGASSGSRRDFRRSAIRVPAREAFEEMASRLEDSPDRGTRSGLGRPNGFADLNSRRPPRRRGPIRTALEYRLPLPRGRPVTRCSAPWLPGATSKGAGAGSPCP